jgi:hypothetical protein
MEKLWKAAFTVAGIGAIAFFVFLSIYKKWLDLPIFSTLTSTQTFVLMILLLCLTFAALIAGLYVYLRTQNSAPSDEAALHRLEQAWQGVNYIDCEKLIGPDVAKAGNALEMTATYWRRRYLSKDVLSEKYGSTFIELFEQIDSCPKQVPGYTKPVKHCKDFLSAIVREVYKEIKEHGRTNAKL